jgi:hypothetical protein
MPGSQSVFVLLLLLTALTGCTAAEPFGALLGADVASIAVFGRSLGDLGASAISGQDCSIVRLERGLTYCAGRNPPAREAYCTRTLATVDCWPAPHLNRVGVGDTPPPSLAQERYRAAPWPKALTAGP